MSSLPDEWLRDLDHNDKRFVAFIEWCYEKFPEQMRVLAETYVKTEGQSSFAEYLDSFESPENLEAQRADIQMDLEQDR